MSCSVPGLLCLLPHPAGGGTMSLSWVCHRDRTSLAPLRQWPADTHGPGQLLCWTSAAVVGKKQPKEKVGWCGDAEHLWQDMLSVPGGDGGPPAMHAASRGFLPERGVHQSLDPDSQPELGVRPAARWVLHTRCAWCWFLCRQEGGGGAHASDARLSE